MSAREKVAEAIWREDRESWQSAKSSTWAAGIAYGAHCSVSEECREKYRRIADAAIAAHLEVLKADGHAVVKLPEPTYGPDGEGQYGWTEGQGDISATPNGDGSWSVWDEDFQMTPDEARDTAADLLAAAAKAEADE